MRSSKNSLSIFVCFLFLGSCGQNFKCDDKDLSFRRCLETNLAQQEERRCTSCLQENGWFHLHPFEDCSQVQELFCNVPSRCGCDPCLEEINALYECWYPACTYKTLCEPYRAKVTSFSSQNCFQTTDELRLKVDGYLLNNQNDTDVAMYYGWPIGKWCVSNIQDFSQLFSYDRNPAAADFNEDISEWDTSSATDMSYMFESAVVFNQDLSDWSVSSVTDMSYMFSNAAVFNGGLSSWDVSSVADMSYMFESAVVFNQDLSDWSVSSVTDMSHMFSNAAAFNGGLSSWDVSRVTDMSYIFESAVIFNQDLSDWSVSSVTDMSHIFSDAVAFNGGLSSWDVSRVTDMSYMFESAVIFNQDLSDWSVSSVTDMSHIFSDAVAFNGGVSSWDVSRVTDMSYMFESAVIFNQDLSDWSVSSVTDMSHMFSNAAAFNGGVSSWDVSRVTDMSYMFSGAQAFNGALTLWDVSSVTSMGGMFWGAIVFNQAMSSWDVSSVTNMHSMLSGAVVFNQMLSAWNVSSVTTMSRMFESAKVYSQDMSAWDVSSVTDMGQMFANAPAYNQNLSPWDVHSVRYMDAMFYRARAFNQNLSAWNVSAVTEMRWMFAGSTSFSQNLCAWGEALRDSSTRVDNMFVDTACPACPSYPMDPILFADTPGPFCYQCSSEQFCEAPSKRGPLCSPDIFKACLRRSSGHCFGSKRRRLEKTRKSLFSRRLELGPDGWQFRVCQEENQAYKACMANFGTTEAHNCVDCMRARTPERADYCFELWDLFCQAPDECCGQCQSEIQKVLECYYEPCEAGITCAVSGENGELPPRPSCMWENIVICGNVCVSLAIHGERVVDALESFVECMAACADPCLVDHRRLLSVNQGYIPLTGLLSQEASDRRFPSKRIALSSSQLSSIGSNTAAVYQENANDDFCRAETAAYQACLGDLGQLAAERCFSCINARFPQNPTYCHDLEDLACDGPRECVCGECSSEIQDLMECFYPPCKSACGAKGSGPQSPWCSSLIERLSYDAKECLRPCLQPIEGEGW